MSAILLNIIIVGMTNLVFTFVALQTVDRLGRRVLTLAGWAGLAVIFVAMGVCFWMGVTGLLVVLLVVAAIGWYASTIAPMCWVTLAEIFPNRIRGAAMATAVFALWVGNFTLHQRHQRLLRPARPRDSDPKHTSTCVGPSNLRTQDLERKLLGCDITIQERFMGSLTTIGRNRPRIHGA